MSNVLFVDDSVTMQKVAEITFRGSDWSYTGARSKDEAVSANQSNPALVLVDAVLADGSGYDLAKELKAANSDAVVLMVCGNSEAYDEGKGQAAGCDGHIAKPWQTDKLIDKLKEITASGPSAAASVPTAPAPAAAPKPAPAKPSAPAKAPDVSPPRSATLMGMPALEMPPSKPLPAGVASIKPAATAKPSAPVVPAIKTPPPPAKTPSPSAAPVATKAAVPPVAKTEPPTPTPPAATPSPAGAGGREPMIKGQPGKPIRLVLASQAEAAATDAAQGAGMNGDQASALNAVSREMLERVIWEVVPDLAESIIRENLDTLTAKAR